MAIVTNGQTGIDVGHLPVSNAGDTEVEGTLTAQGQNVSPFSGFKNYIINGNFDVWQRGTSQTITGYGSDDRWANNNIGSTKTHSQVACSDTERALFNAGYFSRTVVSSVAGASNYTIKIQRIENVTRLAGKTFTVSFWAKADSAKNIAIDFFQSFGTGGTPSDIVNGIGSTTISLTTEWQKKTVTVTIPSIVGKTLGTDGVHTSHTGLFFWFDAGSDYDLRTNSLGQQSGTFDIAQVQLEEGSVATPFENRPYGLELSLCQRYLPSANTYASGQAYSATNAGIAFPFKVQARINPTGIIAMGTFSLTIAGGGTTAATSPVLVVASTTSSAINFTSSSLTAGNGTVYLSSGGNILFTGCEL